MDALRKVEVPAPEGSNEHGLLRSQRASKSFTRGLREWLAFAAEAVGEQPIRSPILIAKALNARFRLRIRPENVIQSGLDRRPFSEVVNSVRYWGVLHPALRRINWHADGGRLVEDKLATAERYLAHGIATAPILAVIGRDEGTHAHGGRFPVANGAGELLDVLSTAPDELIVKPAAGSRGGNVRPSERDGNGWRYEGEIISADEFARRLLSEREPGGLLLQPRLRSHPDLAPLGGELGLCGVRINTALLNSGPKLLFQFVKLMGRPGVVDNFRGGRTGNILAAVDERTGEIRAAYCRRPGQRFLLSKVEHHPVTGARLTGVRLPQWQESLELALRAAAVCPECPLPGADVALTDQGPMILEINAAWDSNYAELTKGIGIKHLFRAIWPELAVEPQAKQDAAELLGL